MRHTTVQAIVILAMGSLLAFAIVLQPQTTKDPTIDVVPGEIADHDIIATHGFAVVQVDTTGLEERRREAAAAVLPIWEFDEDLSSQVESRVGGIFARMRRELKDFGENLAQARPSDNTPEGTGDIDQVLVPPANSVDPVALLGPSDFEIFVDQHLDAINVHLGLRLVSERLSAEQVIPLAEAGFPPELERPLRRIVGAILKVPVVDSLDDLDDAQQRGISLVRLQDGRIVSENVIRDFSGFMDPEAALVQIELAIADLPLASDEARDAVESVAHALVRANINTYLNRGGTADRQRQATRAVEPDSRTDSIREGQLIVRAGEEITIEHIDALHTMQAVSPEPAQLHANEIVFGGVIYVLIVLVGVMTYGVRFIRRFSPSLRDLACMTAVLVVMVVLTRSMLLLATLVTEKFVNFPIEAIFAAIPFAAGAMLVRVVLNAESSMIFAITYSLLVALMMPEYPIFAAYALVGSLAGTGAVEVVRTRMSLFRGGLVVAFVNLAFAVALGLLSSTFLTLGTVWTALLAIGGGIVVAILVTALLPVVEAAFHYISDFKLLELANPDHPALRHLLTQAPGSYHHSMMTASLVETACKTIGANALLGRVGSYYHDIGKTKNPQYFAENQRGKNAHDKLKPHMSALVIKSHVKDGVDMAIQYGLPEEILRFIQEHHGTGLIEFFFRRAEEMADREHDEVNEKDFRYAGPKPQTPETAICMLADGIEAASRSLQDPTPARLQGLVQKMINRAFTDGQLDESDLTLRDLDAIARSMIRILLSIYHQRPEYPNATKETGTKTMKAQNHQEASDGSGDSGAPNGDEEVSQDNDDTGKSTATLRRLGID